MQYSCLLTNTLFTIPNSITAIYSYAIQNTNLRSIYLSDNLNLIYAYGFYNLTKLTSIENVNPNLVVREHFADNTAITEFVLHNTVDRKTFESIKTLKKVAFGSNVTKVGDIVFSNCPALETVIFEGSTPPTFATANLHTGTTPSTFKIYVPDDAVDTYKAVANLSKYKNNIYGISQMTA